MRLLTAVSVMALLVFYLLGDGESQIQPPAVVETQAETLQVAPRDEPTANSSRVFGRADAGRQIRGSGSVVRILSDDNDGSRHQRFILRLASGQTLLVAHNIDLAPRLAGIAVNDSVEFNGEYEWNSQGGVVHWTHHDPAGRHVGGWLRSKGRTYQ